MKIKNLALASIISLVNTQEDCSVTIPYLVGSNNGCDTQVFAVDESYSEQFLAYGGSSKDYNIIGASSTCSESF